jgi:hypothetical protein
MDEGGATVQAECPRCGYDLSGTVATWSDACPVDGRCTECGLGLAWGDVLNPARQVPRWSYEQSRAVSPVSGAIKILPTLARMLWAPGFWRAMKMEFAFRPLRLFVVVVSGMFVQWLIFAVGYAAWVAIADPAGRGRSRLSHLTEFDTILILLWPRTLIGDTSWRFQINSSSVPYVAWWLLLSGMLVAVCFVLLPQSLRKAKIRPRHLVRVGLYGLPLMIALCTVPWIVSDIVESVGILSWKYGWFARVDLWKWQNAWSRWQWVVLVAMTWIWQAWWWNNAVTRYLKLPHGAATSVLLVVLANLLALGLLMLMIGHGRNTFIDALFG